MKQAVTRHPSHSLPRPATRWPRLVPPCPALRWLRSGHSTRGETLVEVMIAVSMLALVVTPATNMYVTSLRTTAGNRAQLVAASLAEEGIEMMRNIRDSNVLRYPQRKTDCWDSIPPTTVPGSTQFNIIQQNCDQNKIQDGSYVLHLNLATLEWGLQQPSIALTANPSPATDAAYQLYLDDTLGAAADAAHIHFQDDTHLYTSNNLIYAAMQTQNGPRGAPTDFYREIFVQHDPSGEILDVISVVRYRVGAAVKSVVRRDSLDRPQ